MQTHEEKSGGYVTIPGNPVSVNRIYVHGFRGRRRGSDVFMAEEAAAWKDAVAWAAKIDWRRPPLDGRIRVTIWLFFESKKVRDIDNCCKLVLDGLERICYRNDNQIDDLRVFRRLDAKKPRVVAFIEEMP